jgi:hypothetical protein
VRFEANDRLLEILVGSNLYPGPDVCVRELVQNSWDAIQLRQASGDGGGGHIGVRYSPSGRFFEVEDDGIGMNEHDLRESFVSVGSNKIEALGLAEDPGEQVALFGIGVLSVFLVAESIEVTTRKVFETAGLRWRVEGLRDDRDPEPFARESIGTTIRVQIKDGVDFDPISVPEAVRKHVRHVPGVVVANVDTGESGPVADNWDIEGLIEVSHAPEDRPIRSGRLGFLASIIDVNPVLSNRITLCNGGFLVESPALDLLGPTPMGFGGEVDLHANSLDVVMARERFQRDNKWTDLGQQLLEVFERKSIEALESGFLANNGGLDSPEVRRCLFAWMWSLREPSVLPALRTIVRERIRTTVPFSLAVQKDASIQSVLARLPEPRLYYRRVSDPTHMTRHIDDEGLPINFNEEVQYGLRVGALRARHFAVVETSNLGITWQVHQQQPVSINVDEVEIIRLCLEDTNVQLLDIRDAPPTDLDFSGFERLPVLRQVLNVGGGELRLARVPESARRVVTDPSGTRYLNVDSPGVRRLLETLPAAVGNPLKRRLLRAYLGLETLSLTEARDSLLELLEEGNLDLMAQSQTSVLTQRGVRKAVERLLTEQERERESV